MGKKRQQRRLIARRLIAHRSKSLNPKKLKIMVPYLWKEEYHKTIYDHDLKGIGKLECDAMFFLVAPVEEEFLNADNNQRSYYYKLPIISNGNCGYILFKHANPMSPVEVEEVKPDDDDNG